MGMIVVMGMTVPVMMVIPVMVFMGMALFPWLEYGWFFPRLSASTAIAHDIQDYN
jgi:hypothetical protein